MKRRGFIQLLAAVFSGAAFVKPAKKAYASPVVGPRQPLARYLLEEASSGKPNDLAIDYGTSDAEWLNAEDNGLDFYIGNRPRHSHPIGAEVYSVHVGDGLSFDEMMESREALLLDHDANCTNPLCCPSERKIKYSPYKQETMDAMKARLIAKM
jgi:hypothetical protein